MQPCSKRYLRRELGVHHTKHTHTIHKPVSLYQLVNTESFRSTSISRSPSAKNVGPAWRRYLYTTYFPTRVSLQSSFPPPTYYLHRRPLLIPLPLLALPGHTTNPPLSVSRRLFDKCICQSYWK